MPETGEPTDPNPDPQQPHESRDDYLVRIERAKVRDMEKRAREGDEAVARAEAAERQLAFAKAGVDLSSEDEKVQFFVQGYNGDLTPDAIKAKAEKFGVFGGGEEPPPPATGGAPADPPPDTPLAPGEANLTQERQVLAGNAPPDSAPPVEPYKAALEVHDKVIEDGGMEKHAVGAAINSLVNAAHQGDERVILGRRQGV